jgi:hypothetical protein
MNTKRSNAGGGLGSRPVKHSKSPKAEPKAHAMNKNWVSQIGSSLGNHITERGHKPLKGVRADPHKGQGYSPPVGPTDNVAACGVGGGRTIYKSGYQGTHGSVAPGKSPERRDILREFGPDIKR